MSVLYKALARASKARDSARDSGAAAPAAAPSRRRGRSALRPLIILVLIVVIVGGVYVTLGDQIADTVNVILFGDQTQPPVAVNKKPPALPGKPQVAANSAASLAPAAAAVAPSAGLSPAAPAANMATAEAAGPPAPASTTTPSTQTAAAAPALTASTPAVAPAPLPAPAPVPITAPAAAGKTAPAKVAAITPEQDLPDVLDRIRQQRTKAALQPSAVVDRTGSKGGTLAAPAPTAADNMVSVTQDPPAVRNDAEHAYDLLLHGQYEGALALYDDALKVDEHNLPALLGKAIALHKLRRVNEARPLYQRVLAIDPGNREALTNLTSIEAAQAPAVALKELRELAKTNPAFSPIPAQIATIEAETGDLSAAIASFSQAIQLSPENGLYRLNMAILLDHAGMRGEAAASYQAALERLGTGSQLPIPIESIRARLRYLQSR